MDFTPALFASPPTRNRARGMPLAGAVRRKGSAPRTGEAVSRPHARKLVAALVLVSLGILATTVHMEADPATPMPLAFASAGGHAAPLARAVPPEPTFYFDDARDALAERAAARTTPDVPFIGIPTDTPVGGVPSQIVVSERVANPISDAVAPIDPPATPNARRVRANAPPDSTELEIRVGSGDTLSGILNDHGVRIEQMPALLDDRIVIEYLSQLRIGQEFTIVQLADGDFHSLGARIGDDTDITIRRSDEGFAVAAVDLPVEKERVVTSGTIDQSLYLAAEQARLKQSTIMELAEIFQWELDFARDIRKGDHFAIVYDRLYRDGRYTGDGDILAAEFVRSGRTHRAIRFVADDDTVGYYSPDGTSKSRTFTRHPVDVVRITSKFNPNRLHPVLHQIRAHRGVDYGSPHGSPIRATADGVVRFAGEKSAYGNTVILQHGDRIKTLYAHMSRISDKSVSGARVSQGDVIGYVGNTGRVTGTHLHYEFRVDDQHVDPLTVELPAASPIDPRHREALITLSDELIAQMRSVLPEATSAVAANDSP